MSKPAPPKYRTTNWESYNHALRQRGSLLIWLGKDMAWFAAPTCKRGRAERYSNAAIQFYLMIKNLFNLALRQTTGSHAAIAGSEAEAIIPVRKNGKPWKENLVGAAACNEALRPMKRLGRVIWNKWSGYHRRSLV